MSNETLRVKPYISAAAEAWLKREREETAILFRCVPAAAVSLFVASVIAMNLLANKTLVQTEWIALDGGILISWLSFLCMSAFRLVSMSSSFWVPALLIRIWMPVRAGSLS